MRLIIKSDLIIHDRGLERKCYDKISTFIGHIVKRNRKRLKSRAMSMTLGYYSKSKNKSIQET